MEPKEIEQLTEVFKEKGIAFFLCVIQNSGDQTQNIILSNMPSEIKFGMLNKNIEMVKYQWEQEIAKQFFDNK